MQHGTGLVRLVNPHDAVWGRERPLFEPLSQRTDDVSAQRAPIIFVHGMEYYSREEIVRDLIVPFEKQVHCFRDRNWSAYDVYIVHWDSGCIAAGSPFGSAIKIAKRALHWRTHLAMIEERARTAAHSISPAIGAVLRQPWARQPLVVTHSLGSLVWSEAVKTLYAAGRLPRRLGTWWNMQPALPWDAFNTGGEYECVSRVYADPKARMSIWYSKLDIVLSTLFVGAKRRLAMGQVGAGNPLFEHCDLTTLAREAHGQTTVLRSSGPFFTRIGEYLTWRAACALH